MNREHIYTYPLDIQTHNTPTNLQQHHTINIARNTQQHVYYFIQQYYIY